MVDNYLLNLIHESPEKWFFVSYLFSIFGGVIAAFKDKSDWEIGRSSFLFIIGAMFFVFSLTQFMWLIAFKAIIGGFVWLLFLFSLIFVAITGFLNIKIALGRSRDACGNGWLALLAFVPVLNIWLLVARPRRSAEKRRPNFPKALRGVWGIVFGLALALAGGVTLGLVQTQAARMDAQSRTDPEIQKQMAEHYVSTEGLEKTLERIVTQTPTPREINETTTLLTVAVEGNVLIHTYQFSRQKVK